MCTSPPRFTEIAGGAFLFFLNLVGQILKCRFYVLKLTLSQINKCSFCHTGLVLLKLLWKQHELIDTEGNEGPLPAPLLLFPCMISDSSPLFSFHLAFENPFMPCLILRCTGHTLPDGRGALETASGF